MSNTFGAAARTESFVAPNERDGKAEARGLHEPVFDVERAEEQPRALEKLVTGQVQEAERQLMKRFGHVSEEARSGSRVVRPRAKRAERSSAQRMPSIASSHTENVRNGPAPSGSDTYTIFMNTNTKTRLPTTLASATTRVR